MVRRTLMPALLALVAALVYLKTLSYRERAAFRESEPVRVLVAGVDLPARTLVRREDLRTAEVPRRFAAPDAVEVRSPYDLGPVAGMVTRVSVPKGSQLVLSALAPVSPASGLAVKVPPGRRGFMIWVDREILRLIKPGDRCDIVAGPDWSAGYDGDRRRSRLLLQNVSILGVDSDLGQAQAPPPAGPGRPWLRELAGGKDGVLSLALTPREAQVLVHAMRQEDIRVLLRGVGDAEIVSSDWVTFRPTVER